MTGMELAGFEASSQFEDGDRVKASDMLGNPLLIYVVDRVDNIRTKYSTDGKAGLILDFMNLSNQEIFLSVLWMNNQIVDNLSRYVGKAVAIRIEERKSKSSDQNYLVPVPLEGDEANVASQWVTQRPNLFVDARAKRELKSYEEIRGSSVTAIQPGVSTAKSDNTVSAPPAAAPVAPPAPSAVTPPSAPAAPAAAPAAAPVAAPTPPSAPAAPVAAPTPPSAPAAPVAAPTPPTPANDDLPF